MFSEISRQQIENAIETKQALLELNEQIAKAGEMAAEVLGADGTIFLCGNGGSAADAQHIAAELTIRYKGGNERRALPAMTLSSDPSTITACGNDYGYDQLFARTLSGWGRSGDLLVAISTSGNSQNVINAIEVAREKNIKVIALLGGDGGKMKGQADHEIIVPSKTTARIQECHILIGHIMCAIIEKKLFNLD